VTVDVAVVDSDVVAVVTNEVDRVEVAVEVTDEVTVE
jgi:hypothetical protein